MSIASELNRLLQAKSDLATSIANKGVTVPASATLDDYAALVDQIQQGGLPYDAEISYIEANGTQYINSLYYPNLNTRIEAKGMYTHAGTMNGSNYQHFMYGVRETVSGSTFCCEYLYNYYKNGSKNYYDNGSNFGKAVTGEYYSSNFRDTAINVANDITGGYIENTKRFSSRDTTQFQCTKPMFILWCNVDGTGQSNRPPYGRIYYLRVYENHILLHDFIPVRVGQVGCLYDRVTREIFENQGAGAFTLGPDVT